MREMNVRGCSGLRLKIQFRKHFSLVVRFVFPEVSPDLVHGTVRVRRYSGVRLQVFMLAESGFFVHPLGNISIRINEGILEHRLQRQPGSEQQPVPVTAPLGTTCTMWKFGKLARFPSR